MGISRLKFAASLGLFLACPAQAEVSCTASKFLINGYVYGMPALENIQLSGGGTMANVSLCGTNCADESTNQRLAVALSAQARGAQLILYFATVSSCAAVSAYDKPYGITLG